MYARAKTCKNKDGSLRVYVQIVEGFRDQKKCRQRVIANLGRLDRLQSGCLDKLIESLAKFSASEWTRKS